jgi:hypothetical protein
VRRAGRPPGARPASFSFRSQAPLFDDRPFTLAGRAGAGITEIVVLGPDAAPAARGTVTW